MFLYQINWITNFSHTDDSNLLPPIVNSLEDLCYDLSQEYNNTLPLVGGVLPSIGELMVAQANLNDANSDLGRCGYDQFGWSFSYKNTLFITR